MNSTISNAIFAANVDLDLYQKVKTIIKRGEEYIQPINTTTKVEIGDAVTDLKGLFDGNTELGTKCREKTSTKCLLSIFSKSHK